MSSPALAHDALPYDERGAAWLEAARRRVVIFDGAMGTSLQLEGLSAEDFGGAAREGCNEVLVLTRPDVVERVHLAFLDAGVDVIETNAFGAFRVVLAEYGLQDEVEEINLAAARIARQAADARATADRPRWVAGNLGPGTRFPTLGPRSAPHCAPWRRFGPTSSG
jgi:5-methyltetrahydrofolate--homocysteine methyltransferase